MQLEYKIDKLHYMNAHICIHFFECTTIDINLLDLLVRNFILVKLDFCESEAGFYILLLSHPLLNCEFAIPLNALPQTVNLEIFYGPFLFVVL